ncbi:hypothetical protein [Macrococcus animalis]|uniref:hypothetical protein n=1 Tax=Macrococcus animalis TaxID=3395467 RepID=UPI0039BE6DE1
MIDFEEKLIQKHLYRGYHGIIDLLRIYKNKENFHYDILLKSAGIELKTVEDYKRFLEFVYDSLRLVPEIFMDKWNVNFWIAREENLIALAKTYDKETVDREELVFSILNAINNGDVK